MLSSVLPLLLLVLTACVSAHWDWVKELPDCWKDCLEDTRDGCDSQKCICDASQSDGYLPPAVSCAATTCDANEVALTMGFLLPLEGFCKLAGNDIPDEVLSGAYEAMTATATATPTTEQRRPATTRKAEQSEKPENPKTTQKEHRVTETLTSTMVRTTTDGEGRTLEIYVPVVIGPDTMSFGKTVTSTVGGESSATEAPSSSSATPSPTAAPTQEEQPQEAPSSTTSADAPERTSNSNGSPFENMQAEAGQWRVSSLFLGLGAAAGMFMRL